MKSRLFCVIAIAIALSCAIWAIRRHRGAGPGEYRLRFVYERGCSVSPKGDDFGIRRRATADKIRGYFAEWRTDSFCDEVSRRCVAKPSFAECDRAEIKNIVSGARFESDEPTEACPNSIGCMFCLNCGAGNVADRLRDIADVCVEMFKETLEKSNKLATERAAFPEYQEKFSRERRILELESGGVSVDGTSVAAEIAVEREKILALERRIAEIRRVVAEARGERIVLVD